MSDENKRDTQFAGFARILYDELMNGGKTYRDGHVTRGEMSRREVEQVFARRAYDLVGHTVGSINPIAYQCSANDEEIMATIPDMAEWPKQSE